MLEANEAPQAELEQVIKAQFPENAAEMFQTEQEKITEGKQSSLASSAPVLSVQDGFDTHSQTRDFITVSGKVKPRPHSHSRGEIDRPRGRYNRASEKELETREIGQGLTDYHEGILKFSTPHIIGPDAEEGFTIDFIEYPLTRSRFEDGIKDFVRDNFDQLLPLLATDEDGYGRSRTRVVDTLIQTLGITNEGIGLLGANYFIREKGGRQQIYTADENYPEGRPIDYYSEGGGVTKDDILALAYAMQALRVDRSPHDAYPQRYFLKSENRYLCANDFGMRVWDEDQKQMVEGDVTNAAHFVREAATQFRRISRSLQDASHQIQGAQEGQQDTDEGTQSQIVQRLKENPKDLDIVLSATPYVKIDSHLHFRYEDIAQKFDLLTDDPIADYEKFKTSSGERLDWLLSPPSQQAREGTTFQFMIDRYYGKPVLVPSGFRAEEVVSHAKAGVQNVLARRAAEATSPEVKEVFEAYSCKRGEESPYFYADSEVYDFIREVGPEKARQIFESGRMYPSEVITGYEIVKAMGYNIASFEPDNMRKQLFEAYKLQKSGIWAYFQQRDKWETGMKRNQGVDAEWFEAIGDKRARQLFREGKRMYYLAQKTFYSNPDRSEDDKFHGRYLDTQWSRFDISELNISDQKLEEHLSKNEALICALLLPDSSVSRGYGYPNRAESYPATLALLVGALDRGQDIRGVAIARDKQRYLRGIIGGQVKDDLAFALEDWPEEWRSALSPKEVEIYYENAGEYICSNQGGLAKYAEWRASQEGQEWKELFSNQLKEKSDLDLRLSISGQTREVRDWYKNSAEYVGNDVIRNFVSRFYSVRNEQGGFEGLHDALYWTPHLRNLESGEAKSLLTGINSLDDSRELANLLPRYSKEKDTLRTEGPITSIRELEKRVIYLENHIDLSSFPDTVRAIITAPGFNVLALQDLRGRPDFSDLMEGRLDRNQPFKPHRRVFTQRHTTDLLKEALGSRREGVKGKARDVKGLFYNLNQLIKDRETGESKRQMQVADLLQSVPYDLEEEVITLLQQQTNRDFNVGPLVEAQIHAKSDPEGWVCGNYTDCCMQFGASNNTEYMFSPSTQYFTIKYNGRIVAQSVVVNGFDTQTGEDVVILDNIEVANNYQQHSPVLSRVYQTFWSEYTSRPVKIGTGYSDLIPSGATLEPNRYRPKTHLEYSDARGPNVYGLPKVPGIESIDKVVTFANATERDAGLIAKMEALSYPEDMVLGKDHIAEILRRQRELEVPGAVSSFIVRQGKEAAAYLLVLPETSEVKPGETVAHIYDMAVVPKFRGGTLSRQMMEKVLEGATVYGVPIEAETRASTSYALLMNARVRKWLNSKGFTHTHTEKLPKYLGNEDFYLVRFENTQSQEATADIPQQNFVTV